MLVLVALVAVGLVIASAPAAVAEPVVVAVNDAEADVVAVSLLGDATTRNGAAVSGGGNARNTACGEEHAFAVRCVAVAGLGSATNDGHGACGATRTTEVVDCVAVAGTGAATNGPASPCQQFSPVVEAGVHCFAASGLGDATNGAGDRNCANAGGYVSCTAVSGTGDATNGGTAGCDASAGTACVAASGTGTASNRGCQNGILGTVLCVAVAGTGRATNARSTYGDGCAASVSVQCVAVSGTGDATNFAGAGCGGNGATVDCVAVSGTGDATNARSGPSCAAGTATVRCVAVSGTGDAQNQAGAGSCAPYGEVAVGIACVALSGTGSSANPRCAQTVDVAVGEVYVTCVAHNG